MLKLYGASRIFSATSGFLAAIIVAQQDIVCYGGLLTATWSRRVPVGQSVIS